MAACLAVGLASPLRLPASAQEAAKATLGTVQIEAFPRLSAYLDVRDAEGKFISGLQESNLTVLEDGVALPVVELNELTPGAQFVVAISPGRSFTIRDGSGISRYDLLSAALRGWLGAHSSANDDLSLFVAGGAQIVHTSAAAEALPALDSIPADARNTEPTPDVLFAALETALDPSPRPGMGRGVLLVTAPLSGAYSEGLQGMVARAREMGVRVHVWLVASPDYFVETGPGSLQDLAKQTGGTFFGFSGLETFPDPETYLAPLRQIYAIAYDSQASSTGVHQVFVEVKVGEYQLTTPPQPLDLTIAPPNPMLVSAPQQILRQEVEIDEEGNTTLRPGLQSLEVIVDFPDNLPRPLLTTTLFVDGLPIATVQGSPVGSFSWDLGRYITSSVHLVRVETVDSLGLRGTSIEFPVAITVQRLPTNVIKMLSRNAGTLAGLAALLGGAVFGLVLILRGRIRPHRPGTPQAAGSLAHRFSLRPRSGKKNVDPLVQPVESQPETSGDRSPGWIQRLPWPQKNPAPKPVAYLTPVAPEGSGSPQSPIPISAEEIVLGCDPRLANLPVDDPSVEPVHARLLHSGETYRLSDEGSVAGTWVNYSPVSGEGTRLEHGDLVHIGKAGYRFTLHQPARLMKAIVKAEGKRK